MAELEPQYEEFKRELMEARKNTFLNKDDLADKDILRAQCGPFTKAFIEKFPELSLRSGFIMFRSGFRSEHFWCVKEDGTIVDPTVDQFHWDPIMEPAPRYKVFNPEEDEVYLGKCPNCGEEIHGISEGPNALDFTGYCDDECAAEYGRYVERAAKQF